LSPRSLLSRIPLRRAGPLTLNSRAPAACRTLPLHGALPISGRGVDKSLPLKRENSRNSRVTWTQTVCEPTSASLVLQQPSRKNRSEEHTSELQSRENLVCRLLLEKKNKTSSSSDPSAPAHVN